MSSEVLHPLSSPQHAVWLDQSLAPDLPCYNIGTAVLFEGPADPDRFEAAVRQVAQRHAALRIVLERSGDGVRQRFADIAGASLQRIDLCGRADAEELAWQRMRAAFDAPFDLYGQPLWRMQWLQVTPQRAYWLLCFHHLVADGWAVALIGQAVSQAYNRLSRGEAPEPEDGSDDEADYRDFIARDAEYLASPRYAKDREFWTQRYARLPDPLFEQAPGRRGRFDRRFGQAVWSLERARYQRLSDVAAAQGGSGTHFIAAALAVYFARIAGREDEVVIGMPVHNRTGAAQRRTVGMFAAAMPVGITVDARAPFAAVLAQTAAETKRCYRHQRYPLADLHRELLSGVGDRRGLFDLSLSMEGFQGDLEMDGAASTAYPLHNGYERQPLAVYVRDYEQQRPVRIEFNYDPDAFGEHDMAAHLRRLERLVLAAIETPEAAVGDLPLMDETERTLVLHRFNEPQLDTGAPQPMHRMFERHAQATPDAIAVQHEDQALSYGELNRRANRLAHHLRGLGVGPDALVAIGLERGLDLVVAILATLKAGGAYVPLDPVYPDERLLHMLDDSAPVALIGDEDLIRRLQPSADCRLVRMDSAEAERPWARASSDNPEVEGLTPAHLAYVIYTSGSTGLPKGVMVEHAQVSRLFAATQADFGFGRDDVWTLFHSFAFDFSVWELWGALIHGGRLIVVPHAISRAPAEFHRLVCEQGVTVLNQTPSAFRQFVAAGQAAPRPHALRYVIFGGEALEMASLKPWYAQPHNLATRLVNMYGITETTVHVTYRALQPADAERPGASPIGTRIGDLSLYVLDPQGRPLPVGCTGEMYVGGAGVARGYLRRPQLDAQRFLPDRFSGAPGARMYRTGDLGRYLADGTLEYFGRNDQQVKIRGFRIELGEIEAQLSQVEGVGEAVVVARADVPGDQRLVAYLVAGDDAPLPEPARLREALRDRLPDYMLPAAYVRLPALPLTANGKLDRKALPAPDDQAYRQRAYEAPRGGAEQALARIWAELLGVEQVGRDDNFFELGGHSILAVQLVERLQREGLPTTIRDLFSAPSLAALAANLAGQGQGEPVAVPANAIAEGCERIVPEMLPLVRLDQAQIDLVAAAVPGGMANIQDIYPLAPLQEGILFHHLLQRDSDAYVLPALLRFDDRARLDHFLDALQRVIARHDILRTSVQWEGLDEPVQVVWRRAEMNLHTLALDPARGDVQAQLQDRADPRRARLDLRRAPMLQAYAAFDPAGGHWLLQLLHHHLTLDHTTTELILHEVVALLQGRGDELPAPVPFRDFVARARHGVGEAEHEAYFHAMLGDLDEPTAPFGLLDVQGDGSQVEQARRTLPAELSARLRRLARAHGVGAASLFHLAWAQVLGQCSGRDDVVFGTVLFGRMQGGAGIDRAMGMFINTLPVRIVLGGRDAAQALRETHERLSGLLRHEQASLTLARRCSGLGAGAPMFSALLNYRHSRAETFGESRIADGIQYLGGRDLTNYPFSLYVDDLGSDFVLTAEIHASVRAERIADFVEQALTALAQALERSSDAPLSALDALPAAERQCVLYGYNDTRRDYAAPALVHEAFEQQAAAHPERIALELDGAQLSYRALNEQANRLARHLRGLGVGPDQRVAICVERSLAMVVAILATLKAGGAYVPLDPAYPDERLAQMLRDSRPAAVLSQHRLLPRLAPGEAALVLLDEAAPAWAKASAANVHGGELGLKPEHLAYVIYTSGSTGVPKGVAMPHRGLVNLLAWQREQLPEPARTLQFAALGFDVAFQEIFSTLGSGGTLVLLHEELRQDLPALAEWLAQESIERLFLPYIALSTLSELWSQRAEPLPMLQDLITAGEQLRITPAIRRMFAKHPQARLHNHYGPTESHVVSAHTLDGPAEHWEDLPPIGRPIGNSRVYLLDAQRRPVPVGVAGELYLGGVQVAQGYLQRPELSAQRFLADPFDRRGGGRMYKTGDLGRWREDGTIEYLGRNDFQVKVRGYRIELGEIEAQLTRADGVREAVVIARDGRPGETRLVAYLIVEPGAAKPEAAQLRAQLSQRLPDYMLPAAYVVLEAWPLTPNGKLERKALPAPDGESYGRRAYAEPQGEVEQALAAIWSQLLGVERVGRDDDFFELGGHSLLAIRLLEQLRRRGWSTDIRSLFAHPTLAALAAAVQGEGGEARVAVPPNRIPPGCEAIAPAMLPLVALDAAAIERIVRATPGGAANIQDIYPLAPLQQGILFHHLLQSETDTYVLPTLLEFDDRARLDRFVAALQRVVARHDILRTAVHWEGLAEPVQVVWRRAGLELRTLELAPGPQPAEQRLREHPQVRGSRIDVRRAPMLHGYAARAERGERWLLLLAYHHLVMDHTTLERLVEEIAAIERGDEAELPAPVPFRDFVAQARLGIGEREHEGFFRAMLGDLDEPTAPFGLLDVQGDGSQIEQAQRRLPAELAARLRRQATAHGVGAASLFHLAWAQVLGQCSGRDDVVFGTVLFGRMHGGAGADRAVGMFINTLPLRLRLGGRSARQALRETHERLSGLLRHEHASLALAQRCSAMEAHTPLFSALLNYRHSQVGSGAHTRVLDGVRLLDVRDRTNYPFGLYIDDSGRDFELTVQVAASVRAERIADFVEQALTALAQALERSSDAPLSALDALPAAERQCVLYGYNDTRRDYAAPALVHEAFEQQAAAHPERIALELDGAQLSYRALNEQANRLARHLRGLGVGPDQRVAICVERSLAMVVAILATLKAGGAYVPLDPAYPDERLAQMLRDSRPAAVLSQHRLLPRLAPGEAALVLLDEAAPAWAKASAANVHGGELGLKPEHLAYVIYTSGSTGVPKGVAMPHRGLVNLLAWQREQLPEPARTLQFAALGFDVAFQEIFSTLGSGGTLVLLHEELRQDLPALAEWLAQESIERLFLPYIALSTLSELWSQRAEPLPMLQDLITAGEQLRITPAIRRMFAKHPQARLHNHYGPTESHVVSAHTLDGPAEHWEDLPPIGRPIGNSRVYLLDAQRRPVPVGVAGELYLGGVQVAQGYLQRPELSAQRFLADPFDRRGGGRMYKTGDLGRWREDGTIEYLGRNDFQVKVRGYRIELGEIEAQLTRADGVCEAVVIARDGRPGETRLVAYLIVEPGAAKPEAAQLRAQLSQRLPDYMLPAAYAVLEAWPLTPNGKLDRKALPAPDGESYGRRAYAEPQGEVEQALAAIWSQLLGVERVGRDDDFFELGGHSLLAIRLISQVRERLDAELALSSLFAQPRLAALAVAVAAAGRSALAPIPLAGRSQPLPLSPAQQRLWFVAGVDPLASAAYHVPGALRLRGALDRAALRAALDRVVARHESLRTRFVAIDGQPWQTIDPPRGFALSEQDAGGLTPQQIEDLCREAAAQPFDLAAGPPIRGRLLRVAADEHVLLVTMHHIVSDGWSLSVLMREVATAYSALRENRDPPEPALPVQYPDYAVWLQHRLDAPEAQAQLASWVEHLRGAPSLVELPTDRPRPPLQDYRGASLDVGLDAAASEAVRNLAQRHGATAYMVVLAAWAAVVARYSGQRRVVLGSSHAGRDRVEIEPLIGFFVNTQAIQIDLDAAASVGELLAQVRQEALRAQERQQVPFERLVEALNPPRSMAHSPVFQLMLTWHNTPDVRLELAGLEVERVESLPASAQFDLALDLQERDGRVLGKLNYATALYDEATVRRHWEGVAAMLRGMAADDGQPVERIDLLDAPQRQQLLQDFAFGGAAVPAHAFVQTAFERQAAQRPDAVAIEHDGEAWTYSELDRRANRLAHYLRGLGLQADDRIALCLQRGPELIVAVLATLKAGAAYVPLDPAHPDQRLAWLLQDCAPAALLTQSALRGRLQPPAGCRAIALDATAWEHAPWAAAPAHAPDLRAWAGDGSHLAYVIYTSGSTGTPKGVMVEHRQFAHQVAALQSLYSFVPEDRVLQFSGLSFDVAGEEIFGALSHGATLVLRTDDWLAEPQRWCELCDGHRLTVANLPTLFWQRLAQTPAASLPARLRQIVIGGDAVGAAALEAWWRRDGHLPALANAYGPTETTINASVARCRADDPPGSIGRPVANARIYLLDPQGQPVPLGAVGEICIGGAGVARGYLHRPELTAQRFLADPFAPPGAQAPRMYRSGDLGRWRNDGTIEFLGRDDQQVKLRGFRIELGEIEAELARLDGIAEAAVILDAGQGEDRRLLAYVVAAGERLDPAELRAGLAERLPDYMLPAAFVRLPALPLNANGKLDRAALPALEGAAYAQAAFEPPQGEHEIALARLWSQLLGVEAVGRGDGFFELGGHSLLAVRMISQLRQRLGVELALSSVFARPRLAELAAELARSAPSAADPIPQADRSRPLPLSHSQQRLWYVTRIDAQAGAAYHLPGALRLRGELDRDALQAALDRIVARHETLRARFFAVDGQPRQRIEPWAPAAIGYRVLEGLDEAALRELCRAEAAAPFDLEREPPLRVQLLRLAQDEHVLLLTLHHIVADGWSLSVLAHEFSTLYRAFRVGQADPLPALPVQYADYAAWQRQRAQGAQWQRQLQYWVERLGEAPPLIGLATDRPRPPSQDYLGARFDVALDPALGADLSALAQRHGATLYMVVLAAWAAVLGRLSGQSQVVLGSSLAGRDRAEFEPLIGFFVNAQALRFDLDQSLDVAGLLAQAREVALQAQHHREVPFEQVVEALNPARSTAYNPIYQVRLAWQNTPPTQLAADGLAFDSLASQAGHAQFDLSLDLEPAGEGIVGQFNYATALYDEATVRRHWDALVAMLRGMVADERAPVARIGLLDAERREQVLYGFNASGAGGHDDLLHRLFERQAAAQPQTLALAYDGQELSYAELNARANRIAHHLRGLGLRPDDRVALCLERSLDLGVAWWATLKAGGACVPLDPVHPDERLAHMLSDSAPVAVLTQSHLLSRLQVPAGCTVLSLDETAEHALEAAPWAQASAQDPDPAEVGLSPAHLAYVIYTSGSTGLPKGVMVEHRNVLNFLHGMEQRIHGPAPDCRRIAWNSSFGFDMAAKAWGQLCFGRSVHLLSECIRLDAEALLDYLERHAIEAMECTPSHLRMLQAAGFLRGRGAGLRKLLLGGEALDAASWAALVEADAVQFHNMYGPTECSVDATCGPVAGAVPQIGRPMPGARVYLLDAHGEPVPIGVAGEIFIGGAGVARGYLHRPELSAERFVRDPFADIAGARMYKTGDLGRWRADGTIEYLGRNDFQVKIRGYRIELGEIEARLAGLDGVREAVVLAQTDRPGDPRLIAYLLREPDAQPDPADLRARLGAQLPDYMLPTAYVALDAWPLNANGKLDRKALPSPDDEGLARRDYLAPEGEMEARLAAIWAGLLGVERVGRNDNFFELGGHSALAIQLIHLMSEQQLQVDVQMVFNAPTLADLAAATAQWEEIEL
ncbi:amino acid adenylation domain-containing protein [Lysobacter sp. BMK333-48F3]|uniref:non-ribosomal peptide synthetase n=1 Tax=Lysobacter sp. BMK333-48F3 TaxID=2867962 RepID=UPI001C8B3F7B|nr:non-ribosomal peptide synthetase [Lysobacter sp. BMK333-48F3]MBX9403188.1 amino acid adenylation domain-containing protein [Lysobacter sp. BMK333-48F3]